MSTIIVGVDDTPRSEDAVALAGRLARATGAGILAVSAFPYDDRPEAHFNVSMRPLLMERARETIDRQCEPLNDLPGVRGRAIADLAPARALLRVAEEEDAALIVVGSSHVGHLGRLHPGSTAERLLGGAQCPVALAPQGFRVGAHAEVGRIAVAFDGSFEAVAALRGAARIAAATGTPLRVIRVFSREWPVPPSLVGAPGYLRITEDAEAAARTGLERAVAALPEGVEREAAFLTGDPARELARESEFADLMVIGSRGYGPLHSVLLGGVSGQVARTAACPLVIVPHGMEEPLERLFTREQEAVR